MQQPMAMTNSMSWEIVRTCQHSLDRLLSEALCILEFLDSHGTWPADITMDDRGADIARAI